MNPVSFPDSTYVKARHVSLSVQRVRQMPEGARLGNTRQAITWNHVIGFALIAGGAFFVCRAPI
jgi:hypothetical protein